MQALRWESLAEDMVLLKCCRLAFRLCWLALILPRSACCWDWDGHAKPRYDIPTPGIGPQLFNGNFITKSRGLSSEDLLSESAVGCEVTAGLASSPVVISLAPADTWKKQLPVEMHVIFLKTHNVIFQELCDSLLLWSFVMTSTNNEGLRSEMYTAYLA